MLVKDLIDELEGHGLSNPDNIAYFREQISQLDKNDKVFYSLCHPIVACLLQRLGDKTNRDSSILLCKKILNKLSIERYFSHLADWLAKTIDDTKESNHESRKIINDITHLVIAEFIAEGFVLDEIKDYSTDTPQVMIAEGGMVLVAPPEYDGLKQTDYPSEEEYYAAVYEQIEKWDATKRAEVLKYHYYITPEAAVFIVRLNGLKGQIDDHIGEINIYSPKLKKYIKGEHSFSNIEMVAEGRDWVNAAIPIDYVSLEQAKVMGMAKLEEVLDILMLTYRTREPVTTVSNVYAVVVEGREVSSSVSVKGDDPSQTQRNEMMRYLDAFDLTDVKGDGFKFLSDKHDIVEYGQGKLKRRLRNAARWYTKAVASDKDVDILLYSWFAIEGLLKVDDQTVSEILDNKKDAKFLSVIQEFVTAIMCKSFFHSYLRNTYRNFYYLTNQNDNYYDIANEVIEKAALNLKEGDRYRDSDFLKAIPDMMACVNDDIVRDKLYQLHVFYQDEKGLKREEKRIKDDLLMIYRLRNMIVHNAALSCVNISFYAREARYLAQRVIRYVIDRASGRKTLEEILLDAKLDYQVFMMNFDGALKALRGEA